MRNVMIKPLRECPVLGKIKLKFNINERTLGI